LVLLVGQFVGRLLVGAGRLALGIVLDDLVQLDGAVADSDLHGQHVPAARFQLGQQALKLFLAELPQEVFELLLRGPQIFESLVLIFRGVVALILAELVFGLLLILLGVLDLLFDLGLLLIGLLLLLAALAAAALAFALLSLLALLAGLTALAGLAFARLALAG